MKAPSVAAGRIVSAVLVTALSACGGNDTPQQMPSALARPLTEGEAHVIVRGDIEAEFTVPLDPQAPNIFQPPDGGFALNWADETAQGLGVGGPLYIGTRATGDDLSLSITAVEDELPSVFASFDGECDVSITAVSEKLFAGHFVCRGLTRGESTIDAEGEFEASE
jgi:hypothetical protein